MARGKTAQFHTAAKTTHRVPRNDKRTVLRADADKCRSPDSPDWPGPPVYVVNHRPNPKRESAVITAAPPNPAWTRGVRGSGRYEIILDGEAVAPVTYILKLGHSHAFRPQRSNHSVMVAHLYVSGIDSNKASVKLSRQPQQLK